MVFRSSANDKTSVQKLHCYSHMQVFSNEIGSFVGSLEYFRLVEAVSAVLMLLR